MSGSCCCGSSKSDVATVAMPTAPQTTEATVEQPAEKTRKSECCNDNLAKSEKQGCGC